jgi:hypothetical protein
MQHVSKIHVNFLENNTLHKKKYKVNKERNLHITGTFSPRKCGIKYLKKNAFAVFLSHVIQKYCFAYVILFKMCA